MITVFASNQPMAAPAGGAPSVITTDPVPMNGNDRVSGIVTTHYVFGPTTPTLTITVEGSNDGTAWVDFTPGGWPEPAAAGSQELAAAEAIFAFVRMRFSFTDTGSGNAFICFDVHAVVDKS
jgi:hypothetical protein